MKQIKTKNTKNKVFNKGLAFVLPIALVGLVALLVVFAPIHTAHAVPGYGQASGITGVGSTATSNASDQGGLAGQIVNGVVNIAYFLIGKFCFTIAFLISWICGVFIGIETWIVSVILNMNSNVFSAYIVTEGFSVSLSLANLGFVFGIIIIAIATILRNQTYGIKQILWKLVVMAIFVNFGLIIMSVLFNFADQFTNYFLKSATGSTGFTGDANFANSLAGAFNPQKEISLDPSATVNSAGANTFNGVSSNIGSLLVPIFSLGFTAASLIVIIITLAVFVVMLLIRYLYIAILAVLLPFAWMLWVFPSTKKYFDQWWAKFVQWTIFAPVVLFFLWLAIMTAHNLSLSTIKMYPAPSSISNFFGALFTPIIQNALNEIVLVGLMVGGMIAANSLGITGASAVISGAKKVGNNIGKAAGNYASNRAKKATRAAYQKVNQGVERRTGRGITQRLQESGFRPFSAAGRGLASISTNQKMVDDSMARWKDKDAQTIKTELKGNMSTEDRLAALKTMSAKGNLSMVRDDVGGGKSLEEFMDSNGGTLKQYGQGGLSMDIDAAMMSNKTMREAQRQISKGEGDKAFTITERDKDGKDTSRTEWTEEEALKYNGNKDNKEITAEKALQYGADKLMGSLDVSKIDPKLAFSEGATKNNPQITDAVMEALAKQPRLVPNMMSKMKGNEFDNFTKKYGSVLDGKINQLKTEEQKEIDLLDQGIKQQEKRVDEAKASFENAKKLPVSNFATLNANVDVAENQGKIKDAEGALKDAEDSLVKSKKEKENLVKNINEGLKGPAAQWRKAKESLDKSMAGQMVFGTLATTANSEPAPAPAATDKK